MPDSNDKISQLNDVAESYYDSGDADSFYFQIWGGEDIHIGLYDTTDDIGQASRLTVTAMGTMLDKALKGLGAAHKVLDIGAGYGGAARHLAKRFGCAVDCLNISKVQNATNKRLTAEQGLSDKVRIVHGSFEEIPEPDGTFDVVWSQDAILHSGDRLQVLKEVKRVLKPGGVFVWTDPMQADDCPEGVLQPVYDRIHLDSLASFAFYRQSLGAMGFTELAVRDLTGQLPRHYGRVAEVMEAKRALLSSSASGDYLDRMLVGLNNWVKAGTAGHLAWGIMMFRKG
ncbi:MAG: methyltransferase domain-containing protein [Rhodospirillum sp.]|nr:methyltransferase domain-containing protein [Rhodospirillum sp.]MCF8488236.1 methyltransferase domain-containing protein [Rhodospirillum sp.]MCF8501244.1 methyltransferase domain-containing protein [Rhodospirillum sp.]